jgi:hypothetical protein
VNGARLLGPVALVAAAAITVVGSALGVAGLQEQPFPHAPHQGLFPVCTGCHEGVPLGDADAYYPRPATCQQCHDGVRETVVAWAGPSGRIDNLTYDHAGHDAEVAAAGEAAQSCVTCHVQPGGERMAVADDIQVASCWTCHQGGDHEVDADCTVCHVSLAETRFDRARIESFVVPTDHDAGAFLDERHGSLVQEDVTRCATCHTQERCAACHVDVGVEAIAGFPAAGPDLDLPDYGAHYNEPATHVAADWLQTHGTEASRDGCATCHTSDDCASCHLGPTTAAIDQLPTRQDVAAPGVMLQPQPPASHGSFFFMKAHTTLAAASDATCATCHEERFCVSCHDGPPGGGYHPPDFVSRHAADAFGQDTECANCHSSREFCRACHSEIGLASLGGRGGTTEYHDDGPVWLLRHGQAARQNLEGCAGCHREVDCTQCHSEVGAFQVSPHRSGFDAERAWQRSARTCLACHVGNPLG